MIDMPSADPIALFLEATQRAQARQVDTTPVTLATADARGRPSARMVLLRGADARGFAFFTNYTSRKARELSENPHAALCMHWPTLEEQIRIEGRVERVSDEESDEILEPAARQPDWRLGIGPEPGALVARYARPALRRGRAPVRWPPRDPPSLLGRLSPDPGPHGVLAGPRRSTPRSTRIRQGRHRLADGAALSVSNRDRLWRCTLVRNASGRQQRVPR